MIDSTALQNGVYIYKFRAGQDAEAVKTWKQKQAISIYYAHLERHAGAHTAVLFLTLKSAVVKSWTVT